MRSRRVLSVGVLISCLACLVVTVAAQKGKPVPAPAYVWEATLPNAEDGFDLYAPNNFVFSTASGASVVAGYAPPDTKSGFVGESRFLITLNDPDLAGGFMAFRNFKTRVPATTAGPCGYPQFDAYGNAIPNSTAVPGNDCVVQYLGGAPEAGHVHPSGDYGRRLRLEVRALGIDFQTVSEGQVSVPTGALMIAVYREEACKTELDPYSGVGLALDYESGSVTIARTSGTTWVVDFALPTWVYEYVPQEAVLDRHGRLTCGYSTLMGKTGTETIHGRIVVTRREVR